MGSSGRRAGARRGLIRGSLFLACALLPAGLAGQAGPAAASRACAAPDSILDQLARIARRVGGDVGISALHVETGARVSLNGERRFPMASVSKVPMALEFLRRVDAGELDLGTELLVRPDQFRPGHSPLAAWSGGRPVRVAMDSLLWLMIGVSDNTATDVLLELSGGPAAATRRLRELGVSGVDVHRSEARTFADLSGLPDTIPEERLGRYEYFRMRNALPEAHRQAARERYGVDPRDTATPDGMTDLLERIHYGAGLSRESHARLLDAMTRSRSGPRRLKGMLPDSIAVAHKTGTMGGAINDVGIITLPDDGGHLIVSIFVNTLRFSTARREATIARMTRVLFDHFSAQRVAMGPDGPVCALGEASR